MADSERLEAIGPRGEACIIIRTWSVAATPGSSAADNGQGPASYRLATGERLNTTDDPAMFETLDRSRRFTLRKAP
jgi:hypothetical protein